MNTKTLTVEPHDLYERKWQLYQVFDTTTGQRFILSKWGTFKVVHADHRTIRGERVSREVPNV
jgi:hypothetical protein